MKRERLSIRLARTFIHYVAFGVLLDLKITGMENIPDTGPCILASNHISNLDPLILLAVLPRKPRVLGKKELWDNPLTLPLVKWVEGIPVNRASPGRESLREIERTLKDGLPFSIFPEGTRSHTPALSRGLPGAGMIALKFDVPVIPIAFTGTSNAFRDGYPHLRTKARMIVGEPIQPEEIRTTHKAQDATDLIMTRIAALLPEESRGAYASEVDMRSS